MNAIQCFRAWMRWAWGKNSVPTSLPAKIASMMAGFACVGNDHRGPASMARRAASTLLSIPPVPTPDDDDGGERACFARDIANERDAVSVRVEQTFDIRQQNQNIRADKRSDHGGELIVVAEADLVHRDGVIFVDDGNDLGVEQRGEGVARVVGPRAIGQIGVGEQDLGDREFVAGERLFVGAHEDALPGRGRRLEQRHFLWAARRGRVFSHRARWRRSRRWPPIERLRGRRRRRAPADRRALDPRRALWSRF